MNIEQLTNLIESVCEESFRKSISKHGVDKLCGYALYSDSSAMSISPSVNTVDHLKEMQEDDLDDAIYYKWSPSEWSDEAEGVELFSHISSFLQQISKGLDNDQDLAKYRSAVYGACVNALERLYKKNFFVKNSVVVFAVSDTEMPDQEVKWIGRLNDKQDAKEFELWIQSLN